MTRHAAGVAGASAENGLAFAQSAPLMAFNAKSPAPEGDLSPAVPVTPRAKVPARISLAISKLKVRIVPRPEDAVLLRVEMNINNSDSTLERSAYRLTWKPDANELSHPSCRLNWSSMARARARESREECVLSCVKWSSSCGSMEPISAGSVRLRQWSWKWASRFRSF